MARFRERVAAATHDLDVSLQTSQPPLVPPTVLDDVRRSTERRMERLERRTVAAVKRRETELVEDVATARAALYPLGQPQERVLNFIPFLARNGPPLVKALLAATQEHAESLVNGHRLLLV